MIHTRSNSRLPSLIKKEVSAIQSGSDCCFIIDLISTVYQEGHYYIILKLMRGGTLGSLSIPISLNQARFYIAELSIALGHLHARGVSHLDLHLHNVLLDSNGHVKLTDFGSANIETERPFTLAMSLSLDEDWCALGCLLYEMITGNFLGLYPQGFKTMSNESPPLFPDHIDDFLCRDFINWIIGFEPDRPKPSFETVQAHPWMKGISWEKMKNIIKAGPILPSLLSIPSIKLGGVNLWRSLTNLINMKL
ncbi:kinase-like domain-containing protein [Melampsora americana]|nr:kinase-like domain-containing protein [Melampsora americana]